MARAPTYNPNTPRHYQTINFHQEGQTFLGHARHILTASKPLKPRLLSQMGVHADTSA